jgi:PleD family two-component response regulator
MEGEHPRILIAAPGPVIKELSSVLADEARPVGGETLDEAVRKLQELEPDLIIVCYAFDEVRPFRLLHYLRHELHRRHVPTILVRALPVPLGKTQEAEIRESYKSLGVDEFFNLQDEKLRQGTEEALRRFRDAVVSRLPRSRDEFGFANTKGVAGPTGGSVG